jgi:putative ABC transport system permease protein
LTSVVAGIAVALTAAEGKDDVATMSAVGAGTWHRRAIGGMQGLFVGLVGVCLGVGVGVPGGLSLSQVDGAKGFSIPGATLASICLLPLLASAAGWVVTPGRLRLSRREG